MKRLVLLLGLFCFINTNCMAVSDALNNAEYWNNSKKIYVYIPQNRMHILVRDSFRAWNDATNGKIGFTFTDFSSNSNIQMEFVQTISNGKLNNGEVLGLTNSAYTSDGKIIKAKIQIPYKNQDNVILDDITLSNVLIHEIGHALGLRHSSNPNSIMYPVTKPYQKILPEDVQSLKNIYGWQ